MEGVFQAEPSNRHANLNYFKLQVSSLTLYGSDMPIFSQPVEIRVSIMDENREPIAPANSVSLAEELRMRHDPVSEAKAGAAASQSTKEFHNRVL